MKAIYVLMLSLLNLQVSIADVPSGTMQITRVEPSLCQDMFIQHSAYSAKMEAQYNLCRYSYSSKRINGIYWENYFSCIDKMNKNKDGFNNQYNECMSLSSYDWLMSDDLQSCREKVSKIDKNINLLDCYNYRTGETLITDNFKSCYEAIQNTNISIYSRMKTCTTNNGQEQVQCYSNLNQFIPSKDAWSKCNDYRFNTKNIAEKKFISCMKETDAIIKQVEVSIGICAEYNSDLILSCVKNNSEYFTPEELVKSCGDYNFRQLQSDRNFNKCLNRAKKDGFSSNEMLGICGTDLDETDIIATDSDFTKCIDKTEKLNINKYYKYKMCIDDNARKLMGVYSYQSCIEDGLKSGQFDYYKKEEEFQSHNVKSSGFFSDKITPYSNLINDCAGDYKYQHKSKTYNEYVRVYSDINFHSSTLFQNKIEIGGMSAVKFNESMDKMFILSDDRGIFTNTPPRIYVFDFKFENNRMKISEDEMITLKGKKVEKRVEVRNSKNDSKVSRIEESVEALSVDPEGMDFLSDDMVVISSEVENVDGNDFLKVFDIKSGHHLGDIEVNDEFRPISTSTKSCRPERTFSNFFGLKPQDSYQDNRNQGRDNATPGTRRVEYTNGQQQNYYQVTTPEPVVREVCKIKYENKGVKDNKGFESLSVTPDKNFLFTGNESSLKQDENKSRNRGWNKEKSRIVKYKKVEGSFVEEAQYFYELDNEIDNGLVEIIALDQYKLLTLERSWDGVKKKITAKIFYVNLRKAKSLINLAEGENIDDIDEVEKELIVDFNELKYEFSPGFRSLENIEGMTLGPKLPNGKQSLIVVSDNNFRKTQRNSILVLEINMEKIFALDK